MARKQASPDEDLAEDEEAEKLAKSEAPTMPPPRYSQAPIKMSVMQPPRAKVSGTFVKATETVSADLRRDSRREK